MGLWHLRRGEFAGAEEYFRHAIERLTRRNPNPYDGEAFYNLGLCLRYLGRDEEAYAAFYKAVWNHAWQSAGYHALAELDCRKSDWAAALDHLNISLRNNTDNLRARNLKALVLRKLKRHADAEALLRDTLALDPLDWWAQHIIGRRLTCDLQTRLDIAHDYARAGFYAEAVSLLKLPSAKTRDLPDQNWGALPLVHYTLGWLEHKRCKKKAALKCFKRAALISSDYCFPSRLGEIEILELAMQINPKDAKASYYCGNLLYDRHRHIEAIQLWEISAKIDPNFPIVWRNLGIGYFNISKARDKAWLAYQKAFKANPDDARLLYERDQLWKRLGETPEKRLRELEKHTNLVGRRDDLSVEFCILYNQTGQSAKALEILNDRRFQPWEGGEGAALGQYVRTQLALGREALARRDYSCAVGHFESALDSAENLGEARHLLANQSNVHYWAGIAHSLLGSKKKARAHWLAAANFKGDFQEMSVRTFSEMTYYSILSWECLGRKTKAKILFRKLLTHAEKLQKSRAKIDYFATSLPSMLLFDDDLQFQQETTALFLKAQAWLGMGNKKRGLSLLEHVLERDPNHAPAADLLVERFSQTGIL